MFGLFGARRGPAPQDVRRVKGWLAGHVALSEDDVVLVAELACREPGCPPIETVITVMPVRGERREWRLIKSVAEVAEADIVAAVGAIR